MYSYRAIRAGQPQILRVFIVNISSLGKGRMASLTLFNATCCEKRPLTGP